MVGVSFPMPGVVYPSGADCAHYAALGIFRGETLDVAFRRIAEQFAERVALSDATRRITYRELDEQSDRLAAGLLRQGLKPLDRVIFQLPNGPELVIALLGCLKAGLVPICTLAAHRRAEIGYLAAHAKARAHFIQNTSGGFDFAAFAREMRDVAPSLEFAVIAKGDATGDDASFLHSETVANSVDLSDARAALRRLERDPWQVAMFQLSGGTSGIPKIIPRFHNEYLHQMELVAQVHSLSEKTIAFAAGPMMHNAPILCYWGVTLWSGGEVVCSSDLSPATVAAIIAERRPTWMGIPLPIILKMKALGLLERRHFADACLSVPDNAARMTELTGARAVLLYGMTEGMISYSRADDPLFAANPTVSQPIDVHDAFYVGDPLTGEVLEEGATGEFCFRGPCSTRGYYDSEERNEEAFTSDGFVRSGDLMRIERIDGRRFISFQGRVKDVVSRGGEKINCQEVERALIRHPSVGAIAIVPMPDPVYGERSCAFVITTDGHVPITVADAGAFLEKVGLAKYKWPERIELVATFPTTSSGKLSKPLLRQEIVRILQEEELAEQGKTQ